MSEEVQWGEPTTIISTGETGPQTFNDAVRNIAKAREAAYAPPEEKKPEEKPDDHPPPLEHPGPEEKDAAPPEEAPSDTTQEAEPESPPPIEPPRSWTKEEKDEFLTYPRDAQEKISRREQERENATRRSQNEAAEKRKALEAEREQTAKARQQYEQALPNLLANINAQATSEFADIRSWADLEKMQAEDFVRFQRYQLVQQKAQAARQELAGVQQRQASETQEWWKGFAKDQDAKFTEAAPEMADPAKGRAMRENAARVLKDVGFEDDLIAQSWEGKTGIPLRDHRLQLLIRDATLWREAQAKAQTVRQTPLPPVVRPGTARNTKVDAEAAKIADLEKQQKTAKGSKAIDIGTQIIQLKRAAGKL